MKKYLITLLFLLFTNKLIQAQTSQKLVVVDKTKTLKAELNFKNCETEKTFEEVDYTCDKVEIIIYKNNKVIQKLKVDLDKLHPISKDDLKFADCNFDGIDDVITRNETLSGYGNPGYNIYLYNKTKNQFELNKAITELSSEINNIGLFDIDNKNQRLVRNCHVGGPRDWFEIYKIVNNKPIMIKSVMWHQSLNRKSDDDYEVEIKELKNNKWTTMKRVVKEKELDKYIKK
jgi:hypothetical protein